MRSGTKSKTSPVPMESGFFSTNLEGRPMCPLPTPRPLLGRLWCLPWQTKKDGLGRVCVRVRPGARALARGARGCVHALATRGGARIQPKHAVARPSLRSKLRSSYAETTLQRGGGPAKPRPSLNLFSTLSRLCNEVAHAQPRLVCTGQYTGVRALAPRRRGRY